MRFALPLEARQIIKRRRELTPRGVPVCFFVEDTPVLLTTGEATLEPVVYNNFSRETAAKIASWTGTTARWLPLLQDA